MRAACSMTSTDSLSCKLMGMAPCAVSSHGLTSDNQRSYSQVCNFDRISSELGVIEKEKHTIVKKWPTRLKLRQSQDGVQEEFRVMLASNMSRMERYVEWRRVD